MDINLVQNGMPQFSGGAVPEAVLPAGRAVAQQIAQPKQQPPQQPQSVREFDAQATEDTRQQNVLAAARQMITDIYAVTDMKFSIYKDGSGQIITRFTSLRDGAVTYIPEQDMNIYLESSGARRKALLQLDV